MHKKYINSSQSGDLSTYRICSLSSVPVRARPSHKKEIVTQILFGERVIVLDAYEEWLYIRCCWDGYEGWVDKDQLDPMTEMSTGEVFKTYDWSQPMYVHGEILSVPMGASLYDFDGMTCRHNGFGMEFGGRAMNISTHACTSDSILSIAKRYLNTPYLWGGRSPAGIDCSGFVQQVFSFFDIHLPRDAKDQSRVGETIPFLHAAEPGDIAYFSSERGKRKITHVGILLGDSSIIHSSSRVRIDPINQEGIYRDIDQGYTHYLRIIRRVRQKGRYIDGSNEHTTALKIVD